MTAIVTAVVPVGFVLAVEIAVGEFVLVAEQRPVTPVFAVAVG